MAAVRRRPRPRRLRRLLRPAVDGRATPPARAHLPTVMLIAGADKATPVADQLRAGRDDAGGRRRGRRRRLRRRAALVLRPRVRRVGRGLRRRVAARAGADRPGRRAAEPDAAADDRAGAPADGRAAAGDGAPTCRRWSRCSPTTRSGATRETRRTATWRRTGGRSTGSTPIRRSCWSSPRPTARSSARCSCRSCRACRARGALRAQLEAVRVASGPAGHRGLGAAMVGWAIEEARRRGLRLVQLTTRQASRADAHRFYERLGFRRLARGLQARLCPDVS